MAGSAKTRKAVPAISPACPAVVRMIQTKFPSLLHVAPYVSAIEAAASELAGRKAIFVALSGPDNGPGRRQSRCGGDCPIVLRKAVEPHTGARWDASRPLARGRHDSRRAADAGGVLRVTGCATSWPCWMPPERPDGRYAGPCEPWACDEGCFGSPLPTRTPLSPAATGRRGELPPATQRPSLAAGRLSACRRKT